MHLWYLGIPFSILGVILIVLAYPVYQKKLVKNKEKYASEILELSKELLADNE